MGKKISTTMSIEDIQAIMNAEGEVSPNTALVPKILEQCGKFEHVHETTTNNDCYLAIFNVCFGKPKDREDKDDITMAISAGFKGCEQDIEAMLSQFLHQNPDFIPSFARAIADSISKIQQA